MATFKITGSITDLERRYLVAMDTMILHSYQALAVFYVVHGAVDKETYTREQVFQETGRVFGSLTDRGFVRCNSRGLYELTSDGAAAAKKK